MGVHEREHPAYFAAPAGDLTELNRTTKSIPATNEDRLEKANFKMTWLPEYTLYKLPASYKPIKRLFQEILLCRENPRKPSTVAPDSRVKSDVP